MAETKARKPAALIAAEKKITELENQVRSITSTKEMYCNSYNEAKKELDGVHAVLDTLDIPRKGEGQYNDYPLSVRLFAWAMRRKE